MLASISGRFAVESGPVHHHGGSAVGVSRYTRASCVPGLAGALHTWVGMSGAEQSHITIAISECRGARSTLMFGGTGRIRQARSPIASRGPIGRGNHAVGFRRQIVHQGPSESSTMSSTAQARPRLWRNYRDNLHAG